MTQDIATGMNSELTKEKEQSDSSLQEGVTCQILDNSFWLEKMLWRNGPKTKSMYIDTVDSRRPKALTQFLFSTQNPKPECSTPDSALSTAHQVKWIVPFPFSWFGPLNFAPAWWYWGGTSNYCAFHEITYPGRCFTGAPQSNLVHAYHSEPLSSCKLSTILI